MGSARDRAPDLTRTPAGAHPTLPTRPRLQPITSPESRSATLPSSEVCCGNQIRSRQAGCQSRNYMRGQFLRKSHDRGLIGTHATTAPYEESNKA